MTQERYNEIQSQPHDWIPEVGERVKVWRKDAESAPIIATFKEWHWEDNTITVEFDNWCTGRFCYWDAVIGDPL